MNYKKKLKCLDGLKTMLNIIYRDNFYNEPSSESIWDELVILDWVSTGAPREEYFMSKTPISYTYGSGRGVRTYESKRFDPVVEAMMDTLNKEYKTDYNVCFLNYYKDQQKWLGWHSDDSPEMDSNHPIAVMSFGAERDIYCRPIGFKGEIPDDWKTRLGNGSLFVMPSGFQETHQHKIPKADNPKAGPRISLTFRRYVNGTD